MIYVLVPAFNEAPTVGLLLWKVRQLFTSFSREYQLIVVNDGSTDATEEVLAPYTRALPLTLLTHRRRQGYARSLEALLREAVRRTDRPRRDMAVTIQADFSESPDDVLELIKRLEGGADIVVADRRNRAGVPRSESLVRKLLPRLVRSHLKITGAADVVGTMRAYRLGTIERLVRDAGDRPFLGHDGWAADLELLARAAQHARRIESVALDAAPPERARPTRLAPLREAWRAFRASAALRGLPMPALDAAAPPEPPVRETAETVRERRDEDPRGRRAARQGREHGQGQGGRDRRQRHERRRHSDHRPKVERQQAAASDQRPRREKHKAEPAAAAPRAAEPNAEVTPPAAPAQPSGEGGARRKRRRRGRGRGRGRGEGKGPQGGPPQQPPSPPPAA